MTDVEPAEIGLDAARLRRIDEHFARYVDDGQLPGWLVLVSRRGRIAHLSTYGQRDIEAGLPVQPDTLFRIYSMTKPITSVAAMMLYEQGAFQLTDPISRFLPEFADMRVFVKGTAGKPVTVPATEPIRVWHLLTHTAGLTYGFHHANPVDAMYRAAGFEFAASAGKDLAASCAVWATLPLLFEPGTEWNYSISTDVLGRLVEVVGGKPLDDFFAERIFQPLAMTDTGFWVDRPHAGRLAALYTPQPGTGRAIRLDAYGNIALRRPETLSGGDGLVSSARDYHRFARMLACGGKLEGVRLLGPRTVRYMTRNHLPGGADLETFGRPVFAEARFEGVGFGLGFAVVQDPVAYRTLTSVGEFAWGGLASTAFWVDPAEDLIVLFLTQLVPSSTYPIRTQLRQLVNQALVD
ncbi:MAG: beta-lactamase family protein [Actinomycetota bacterium]|nr:beta-lactamase family protein [Actinomycetota bacterium]